MEVEGRKNRKSLYQGSDDVQDFPCTPCAKENKNVAAVKHCVECDENLCKTCIDDHNKFSVMKGHQLLDNMISPSGQGLELPSQRCDRHGGKLIDVYCPDHDKVGCSTCIAVEHGACRGIGFIPDLAKHSRSAENLQLMETAINNLQSRFGTLKLKKQKDFDNLKQERDKLLQEIRSERKKINDKLDEMEEELLNEVRTSYQLKLQNIDADIKEAGNIIDSLRNDQQKIQAAKGENVSEKFVQFKLGHAKKEIKTSRFDDIERSNRIGKQWFDSYNQITSSKINIIGQVVNYSVVENDSSVGEFDVKADHDSTCNVIDICLDTDGNIVMTDYDNKRIKKMNRSYNVTSCLTVNDNPFGVCQIDTTLFAVTLMNKKKVQFISKKDPMTLQKSFTVGDRCRGIAYNDGLIYVCCGGSRQREEGVGHLEVYTISGSLLTSYYGEMECPSRVSVPSWTTDIYISDGYGDHFIVKGTENIRKIAENDKKFQTKQGICWINRSQMCFAGRKSNNIILMSCDGKVHEELLTEKDGLEKPRAVCFDEKQSRLLVSMEKSNKIKVYILTINS